MSSKRHLFQIRSKSSVDLSPLHNFKPRVNVLKIKSREKALEIVGSDNTFKVVKSALNLVFRWNPTTKVTVDMVALVGSIALAILEHRKLAQKHDEDLSELLKDSLYREAALMANDVYEDESKMFCGGWEESHEFQDLCFNDEKSGLKSRLYCRTINGRKEYMYATAGTRNIKDWMHNLFQVVGASSQYSGSLQVAKDLSERIGALGGILHFTGHSQGGGEATCNALATGNRAIVFNPAGLSNLTMRFHGIHCGKTGMVDLVTNFIVDNDPLNILQDAINKHPIAGRRFYIQSQSKSWRSHSMDDILNTFTAYLPYNA